MASNNNELDISYLKEEDYNNNNDNRKKILFVPLNSPGHINSSLGIADKLKKDFNYRTIFLIIGEMIGNTIVEHGHELIKLDELNPYEDYEISSDEDLMLPLDEEKKLKLNRKKLIFSGCNRWPQIVLRYAHIIRLPPVESFIKSTKIFEANMTKDVIEADKYCKKIINLIKPHLIIIDAYYIPPAIVSYKGCPWIRLYSANPLGLFDYKLEENVKIPAMCGFRLLTKEKRLKLRNNDPIEWENLISEWRNASNEIQLALESTGSSLNDYIKTQNCEPIPKGKQCHDSPFINLYMFPKELDYDQDDDILQCPPRYFRCDSLMRLNYNHNDKSPKLLEWENKFNQGMINKEKSIFFSLGTIASGDFKLMRKYIDVFKNDQKRLFIISKGVNGKKFDLDSNNMIGDDYVPQTFFLKKVNLAIVHGGNNSLTECFYYGVPMIVLPVFGDQPDNAQRVEDLGLGRKLNVFDVDKDILLKTIDEILADKKMLERCQEIGKKMRARNDAKKASLIVKKLIEEGQLEQSFIDDCRDKDADEINW